MKYIIEKDKKIASVYCSKSDQKDKEKQQLLKDFVEKCRDKNIYVCIFNSGTGDLLDLTKELLVYNYNNPVTRNPKRRLRDDGL